MSLRPVCVISDCSGRTCASDSKVVSLHGASANLQVRLACVRQVSKRLLFQSHWLLVIGLSSARAPFDSHA